MEVYYDIMMDTIQAQMERVNFVNMKLLLVDIELSYYDFNGDAVVNINTLIGNQQTIVLHNDNWWYGEQSGLCGTNQYVPEDGASQLDFRVTSYMLPDPPSGAFWYFRNISSTYINPTSDPLTTNFDNYLDYKIFFATTEGGLTIDYDVKCMSQYEMNFYENHYIDYAENLEVANLKFAKCFLTGTSYNNPYRIQHNYTIFVGHRMLMYYE